MTESTGTESTGTQSSGIKITNIHHAAYRCRDAEQTRWFYEDLLGMKLTAAFAFDKWSGLGEDRRYMHLFFDNGDGNFVAFFDDPDNASAESFAKKDGFDVHIAFEVESEEKMLSAQKRLQDNGVTCLGPLDHHFVKSVYTFDPNGLQVELTCKVPDYASIMEHEADTAHDNIKKWSASTRAEKIERFGAEALDRRGKVKVAEKV